MEERGDGLSSATVRVWRKATTYPERDVCEVAIHGYTGDVVAYMDRAGVERLRDLLSDFLRADDQERPA